jgi:regulator of sigma E protease
LGHFLAARGAGVRVNDFSFGMGPAILKKKAGDTLYAIRLFPIGGFVAMEGEEEESGDGRAFCNKSAFKRFVIIAAGAAVNLLMGYVVLILLVSYMPLIGTTVVAGFDDDARSSAALMQNDKILRVNGSRVRTASDITYEFLRDRDGLMEFTVLRDGTEITLPSIQFEMFQVEEGVSIISMDFKVYGKKPTPLEVVTYSFNWGISIVKQIWGNVIDLAAGRYTLNQLSGPVGVATAIGEASTMGLDSLLLMIAFLTINIGIFNLLPLPMLDGGKLLLILIEGVTGWRLSRKVETAINMAGMMMLILLMVFVTYNDVAKLLWRS